MFSKEVLKIAYHINAQEALRKLLGSVLDIIIMEVFKYGRLQVLENPQEFTSQVLNLVSRELEDLDLKYLLRVIKHEYDINDFYSNLYRALYERFNGDQKLINSLETLTTKIVELIIK